MSGRGRVFIYVCFAFALLLWSTEIGPERLEEWTAPAVFAQQSHAPNTQPNVQSTAKQKLQISGTHKIDQTLFLSIFSNEARANGLIPCLQQATGLETGSLALAATLTLAGKLGNIRLVGSDSELPTCAAKIISDMDFARLVGDRKPFQQAVYWRVDW